jgi:hypothetical protein
VKKLKRNGMDRVRVCLQNAPGHTTLIDINESALPSANADERLYYNGEWWVFIELLADGTPRYERE